MSRFALVCSLVFGLSSAALVTDASAQFAKAPAAAPVATAPALTFGAPHAEMRIAPRPAPDRASVRAALIQARATNLASFRAYQRKGVYPSNTFVPGKLNVWRDNDGHICAAATIIQMSGQDELVNRVAVQDNFIRLADVKQGPLMDWILTSGFTQDEIAMIQEPFIGVGGDPADEEPRLAKAPTVDPAKRAAEDKRLRARYKVVDRTLVKNARKSLDKAVDRLMQNETLAWRLVESQPRS